MDLALFDFDGTITDRDSFIDFIRYSVGDFKFSIGFTILLPILILYKFKIIPNYRAKEIVISYFFKNYRVKDFKELADRYSTTQLNRIIKDSAIERLKWHIDRGDRVIVISASIKCWLNSWIESNSIELISSELEIKDEKLTGKLSGKNCFGAEKVERVRAKVKFDEFEKIYAYGDSRGDLEMLELADRKFYRYFK